jgi:hypothetical protein
VATATATVLAPVSNGGEADIVGTIPYRVRVSIRGSADILFHAWNNEAVAEKAGAAKGSKAKKTDNVESYVYRCPNGNIGIPGEYLRMALINTARYQQDPRSPRKSAMDLFKAAVVSLTPVADCGVKTWDYLDRRRVVVQRNAVTRERPALREGWEATFELLVTLPEYVSPTLLLETIQQCGRINGLADFRPTYGRFAVTGFTIIEP